MSDISFRADFLQTIGIIGRSDAGKSTLLRVLIRRRFDTTIAERMITGVVGLGSSRPEDGAWWLPRLAGEVFLETYE